MWMWISSETGLILLVVSLLALVLFYALKGSSGSGQWWLPWGHQGGRCSERRFAIGMLLLGLPGALFVEVLKWIGPQTST
jgi:hypothetical protein